MTKHAFKKILDPSLFWEFNFERINPDKQIALVIERVITRGNIDQIAAMMNYYGDELMKKEIVKLKGLRHINVNFLSLMYGIPKSKFACYTRKRSANPFWN